LSVLYPRLLPDAGAQLWADLQEHGPTPPVDGPSLRRVVFAATGGTRITTAELAGMRVRLVDLVYAAGGPDRIDDRARATFDQSVARYLHAESGMTPGEASQRAVWSYFGLALVPDVCAWRFPARPQRGYFDERFRCSDPTRHTLARLWLRAHLLHDPGAADPYGLVDVLGENDMDQILARRRDVASTPALVRAVVRAHRDDPLNRSAGLDRDVLRDSLKRLLRLAAFVDMVGRDAADLDRLVLELRQRSRSALTSDAIVSSQGTSAGMSATPPKVTS
jgi:hypothetical protein